MQLYEISNGSTKAIYRRKQADAHDQAKLLLPREEVRIRLLEFKHDIEAIEGLFNGQRPDAQIKRTWALTVRGGLEEITGGKEPVRAARACKRVEHAATEQPVEEAGAFWARVTASQKK